MNSKTISIVSYLGIIGWLIAYFVGKNKTDDLSRYHLKQAFGLMIVGLIANTMFMFLPGMTGMGIGFVLLIFMILGIVNAVNEVQKPIPLVGKQFEGKFEFIK